jgi:hypothetical protein
MSRVLTPKRGIWPVEKIEYVQWLWYCGASHKFMVKHMHCSPGVLSRHLNINLKTVTDANPYKSGADAVKSALGVNVQVADAIQALGDLKACVQARSEAGDVE